MEKIIVEILGINEVSDVAEAMFNPSPQLSEYRFHPQHENLSNYHWEIQWVYPKKLHVGLTTTEGLFNFIKKNMTIF